MRHSQSHREDDIDYALAFLLIPTVFAAVLILAPPEPAGADVASCSSWSPDEIQAATQTLAYGNGRIERGAKAPDGHRPIWTHAGEARSGALACAVSRHCAARASSCTQNMASAR